MDKYETEIEVAAHTVAVRYWDIPDDVPVEDDDELMERLPEEGENRAKEMIMEGYHEGELNCLIEDTEIRGWWEIGD